MKLPSILYAEDSALIAELTSTALRRGGYAVTQCVNGVDALAAFRSAPADFDVLFTDHEMPKLGGLDLVRALRQEGFTGVVIVNSGFLEPWIKDQYSTLGLVEFLLKPTRAADLISILQSAKTRLGGQGPQATVIA